MCRRPNAGSLQMARKSRSRPSRIAPMLSVRPPQLVAAGFERPDHPAVAALKLRLKNFYDTTTAYPAFEAPSDQARWLECVRPHLEVRLKRSNLRILELGAGKSTFARYFSDLRTRITYHAQDITARNHAYLVQQADKVFACEVGEIPEADYDVIISLFVLEHVASPRSFLSSVKTRLAPGGLHVIVCPRYDMPGYIC